MGNLYQEIKSVAGLSFSLAKANFKVRNEGSFFGIFWYLLEPLAFFLILFFIGQNLSQKSIEQYPMYLLVGLIMFNFFNAVTLFSTKVISNNSGFIKSLKINSEAFVLSGVWQFVFSHFFEVVVLIIFGLIFKINISFFIFYLFIFPFFVLFTSGVSFVLSVLGVYVGDLRNVWNVFSRLLWFATPIFYAVGTNTVIKELNTINPLYYFIMITREVIIYKKIPSPALLFTVALFSVLVFIAGFLVFEKFKNRLAERL